MTNVAELQRRYVSDLQERIDELTQQRDKWKGRAKEFETRIADTRRETLEEACRAMCVLCAAGKPIADRPRVGRHHYEHYEPSDAQCWLGRCTATPIHRLLSQPKGETDT